MAEEEVKQVVLEAIEGASVEGLAGSEAAMSSNFKYMVPVQLGDAPPQYFDVQFTIRGIPAPAHITAHVDAVIDACIVAMGKGAITRFGDAPAQASAQPQASASLPTGAPTASAPTALPQRAVNLNDGEDGSFDAIDLLVEDRNGKKLCKIAGGMYKKYGVTVWPEVLEQAGIKVEQLEGGKKYGMAGWEAFYQNNEAGKPHKVVRLEKKG